MVLRSRISRFLVLSVCCLIWNGVQVAQAEDWPRFRGPNGSGVSESSIPVEFGKDQKLKWELELPGRGVSSPIVVGDRVFVTCYSGYGMKREDPGEIEQLKRHLVCVDRHTGEIMWTATEPATLPEDPYSGMGVPAHGYASHTPTSDGRHVYAFYGKSGVFAYDMEGNRIWHTMVGQDSGMMRWGSSCSPILFEDVLIVLASDESETLYGLDANSGEERWKSKAEGFAAVWGTPALAKGKNGTDVVVAVADETWGIDAKTGEFAWYGPGNEGASHSVLIGEGVAYSIGGSRSSAAAVAVPLGQEGEVEESIWESDAASRFSTPVMANGYLFSVASNNLVSCFDAKTGEQLFEERLPERFKPEVAEKVEAGSDDSEAADGDDEEVEGRGRGRRGRRGRGRGQWMNNISYGSPVVAGGKIYITDVGGTIYVIAAKPEFELLAKNDLSFDTSGFNASPALSDGQMFLRSHQALYCIAE